MVIYDTRFANILGVITALLVVIITFYKWSYQYWRRKNVPFIEPTIPFGTDNIFKQTENRGIRIKRQYDLMKSRGWKHGGLYTMFTPTYLVVDLEYVKNVMTKDFEYFTDRGFYYNEKDDPLSAHLFHIGGSKSKNLRIKLTPTFTSGKMKLMFHTLVECIPNLLEEIDLMCGENKAIDIKEVLECFTTDIIGSCAFGLECNTFRDHDSPFIKYGRKTFAITNFFLFKTILAISFPNFAQAIGLRMVYKDVSDFFMQLVKDTVEYREKNKYTRKDFIQLLIDLKNNKLVDEEGYKHDGKTLTIEEIAAQCFVFFLAGFETSSATMTFVLYELGRTSDLQQKVRDEINTVLAKHDGKITYEAIHEMKYMDQVIDETLRMYPPFPFLTRQCVKNYKIPDKDIIIEKDTTVFLPIYAIHHDKDYYPEPEKFDPERFSAENKSQRHHYAHIPFGEGPRACIGMRFGLMQSKVGLAALIKNYQFRVNNKTQQPLKMKVESFVLAAKGEIWLSAEKL